eukprot:Clim_evm26s150 gene=Clim_evmTU26s150
MGDTDIDTFIRAVGVAPTDLANKGILKLQIEGMDTDLDPNASIDPDVAVIWKRSDGSDSLTVSLDFAQYECVLELKSLEIYASCLSVTITGHPSPPRELSGRIASEVDASECPLPYRLFRHNPGPEAKLRSILSMEFSTKDVNCIHIASLEVRGKIIEDRMGLDQSPTPVPGPVTVNEEEVRRMLEQMAPEIGQKALRVLEEGKRRAMERGGPAAAAWGAGRSNPADADRNGSDTATETMRKSSVLQGSTISDGAVTAEQLNSLGEKLTQTILQGQEIIINRIGMLESRIARLEKHLGASSPP